MPEALTWRGTWCPQCGPDVSSDDDGCCCSCGSTCVGDGADQALELRSWLDPQHPFERSPSSPVVRGAPEITGREH
jgi:hypothetical protein